MQFKKKGSHQLDQISDQVTENFKCNNLEKKKSVDFHN
jgi:hypothetical protein